MEKYTYYVSVQNLTCLPVCTDVGSNFAIKLEPYKARVFQKLFQQIYSLEGKNAFRAHLPYIPYNLDELNHDIDRRYKKIYALIHEYGDDETKEFIEQLSYFQSP